MTFYMDAGRIPGLCLKLGLNVVQVKNFTENRILFIFMSHIWDLTTVAEDNHSTTPHPKKTKQKRFCIDMFTQH